jgi:serine phosphatase RsbU (regulator of sigma subunit)
MRGFEVAPMYRSAGELNEVGGDFYDAFEIDGGWMVMLGDVTGRGAEAASLTALARYTIRTAGILTGNVSLAASIADDTLKQGRELSLCSALILLLPDTDTEPVRISILAAGHPLPMLVRAGNVEPVGQSGPLLGAPDEPDWPVATVELAPGDQLVLYTDGVTEARGETERFGEERLRASLASASDATGAVASVESALRSFGAGAPEDDAAVLAIMRSSAGSPTPNPARATATSRA